jgi:hypothetical protein
MGLTNKKPPAVPAVYAPHARAPLAQAKMTGAVPVSRRLVPPPVFQPQPVVPILQKKGVVVTALAALRAGTPPNRSFAGRAVLQASAWLGPKPAWHAAALAEAQKAPAPGGSGGGGGDEEKTPPSPPDGFMAGGKKKKTAPSAADFAIAQAVLNDALAKYNAGSGACSYLNGLTRWELEAVDQSFDAHAIANAGVTKLAARETPGKSYWNFVKAPFNYHVNFEGTKWW